MRNTVLVIVIGVLAIVLGGLLASNAPAQPTAQQLPPDVHPQSFTRLPPLTRDDLDDAGKLVYDDIVGDGPPPKTGPVALSLYSPPIAKVFDELNSYLRYNGVLSPRHTEVAIIAATWEIAQQYEYSAHEGAALEYGAPQAVIDTIKFNREPVGLPPEETVIIKLARAIMRDHKVEPALYAEAEAIFGRRGIVEMVTVMGDYVMVGMVMTTIDQHLPPERPALLPPR